MVTMTMADQTFSSLKAYFLPVEKDVMFLFG